MNRSSKIIVAALMTAAMPWLVAPVSAGPMSSPLGLKNAASSPVETVQYRWRRGGWVGPAIAGAIIGGAILGATQGYGYGPGYGYGAYDPGYYAYGSGYDYAPAYRRGYVAGPAYGGGDVAYCQQRFRSYDARSGTYLGYDGMRHPCP